MVRQLKLRFGRDERAYMPESINLRKVEPHEWLSRKLTMFRPEDLREYLAWEDAWRSALLDMAIKHSNRNPDAFQAAALIVYAGALSGYDS